MMTKETLQPDIVLENINEFIRFWNEEQEDEVDEVSSKALTYEMVKEMNEDIIASQESNVPLIIYEILSDEGLVPDLDEMSERFEGWYLDHHS